MNGLRECIDEMTSTIAVQAQQVHDLVATQLATVAALEEAQTLRKRLRPDLKKGDE